MFEIINYAEIDPILGLTKIFNNDIRSNKINLGIGVYKDESENIKILTSVKKAEKYLLKQEITKNYLDINGISNFATVTENLFLGEKHPIIINKRIKTLQTPGGTGGLYICAKLISKYSPTKNIWISNPSWPNHKNIFQSVGLTISYYDYYDFKEHKIKFTEIIDNLKKDTKHGDAILFHGCCHNPTGADFTTKEWEQLSFLIAEKKILPIFDFAYHGFANNLIEDTNCIKIFAKIIPELIIISSYSKNFSLYNERVGSCSIIANNDIEAHKTNSQLQSIIRSTYSNPPCHGAAIVTTILSDTVLKQEWMAELDNMRNHIKYMRKLFIKSLEDKGIKNNFDYIKNKNGMFSIIRLNTEQINILRRKYAIYLVESGRINFAALTKNNINYVTDAIKNVI